MTRYALRKDYPNHKIGDIIQKTNSPWPIWEWEDGTPLSIDFEPHKASDWWQKIEEEKSLEDYESQLFYNGFNLNKPFLKSHYPRIYWTEVLRCIAKNLNKSRIVNYCIARKPKLLNDLDGSDEILIMSDQTPGLKQGTVYFCEQKDCQKAIDLLGENIKYLFND